jgi:hypothetical protein
MSHFGDFISDVLGADAASALSKATDRSEALAGWLGPRVVLGWLELVGGHEYSGQIPGVEGSVLAFRKAEGGLEGSIGLDDDIFDFADADLTQLAATMTVVLGGSTPTGKLRDGDLVGLGKSVDLLCKSRLVQMLKAAQESGAVAAPHGPIEPKGPEIQSRRTKAAQPGQTPQSTKQSTGQSSLHVTKAQAESICTVCESKSFKKGDFTGCYCLRALAKSVDCRQVESGFDLTFGPDWTVGSRRVLIDILGGASHADS